MYPRVNKTQLFDLQGDPIEMHDLANDASHAPEVARLTGLLRGWQKQMDDSLPLASPKPEPLDFDFSKVKSSQLEAAGLPAKRDQPSPAPSQGQKRGRG